MFELETGLIFWTTVSFLILLALLYWFVFPPLNKVLDQRRKGIEGRLAEAKRAQEEAVGLLAKYREQLIAAEERTAAVFEEAKSKSQIFRDETIKKAQLEARLIIETAKSDIDVYKRRALGDLKRDIAELVVEVSRKVINKELKAEDQVKLIESSLKELEKGAKRKI